MSSYFRAEKRIGAFDKARATILGHPDVTVPCDIRNISRSGMCIALDQEVELGRVVKVEWSDHFLVGRIQRVSRAGEDYRVGLELLSCSYWSDRLRSVLA